MHAKLMTSSNVVKKYSISNPSHLSPWFVEFVRLCFYLVITLDEAKTSDKIWSMLFLEVTLPSFHVGYAIKINLVILHNISNTFTDMFSQYRHGHRHPNVDFSKSLYFRMKYSINKKSVFYSIWINSKNKISL